MTGAGSVLAWSPDGAWIAHDSAAGVKIVAPEGGADRVLAPKLRPRAIAWSADARTLYGLVVDDEGSRIVAITVASGRRARRSAAAPRARIHDARDSGVAHDAQRRRHAAADDSVARAIGYLDDGRIRTFREVPAMSALLFLRHAGPAGRGATLLVFLAALGSPSIEGRRGQVSPPGSAERIGANDNRTPAGTTSGQTASVQLDARLGTWHPDGDRDPSTVVKAFSVQGGPLQIPGPMIRVREGRRRSRHGSQQPERAVGDSWSLHAARHGGECRRGDDCSGRNTGDRVSGRTRGHLLLLGRERGRTRRSQLGRRRTPSSSARSSSILAMARRRTTACS